MFRRLLGYLRRLPLLCLFLAIPRRPRRPRRPRHGRGRIRPCPRRNLAPRWPPSTLDSTRDAHKRPVSGKGHGVVVVSGPMGTTQTPLAPAKPATRPSTSPPATTTSRARPAAWAADRRTPVVVLELDTFRAILDAAGETASTPPGTSRRSCCATSSTPFRGSAPRPRSGCGGSHACLRTGRARRVVHHRARSTRADGVGGGRGVGALAAGCPRRSSAPLISLYPPPTTTTTTTGSQPVDGRRHPPCTGAISG